MFQNQLSALTSLKTDTRIETQVCVLGIQYTSAVLNVVVSVLSKHNSGET